MNKNDDGKSLGNAEKSRGFYCDELPTEPQRGLDRVLVMGASGYIGGRLVPELLTRGYWVRAMVRVDSPEYRELWPGAEIASADAFDYESMQTVLDNIDVVYYLIHSLVLATRESASLEILASINLRDTAAIKGVKRIIYLGDLTDTIKEVPSRLANRKKVADELKKGSVPVTVLRASVIIGSGSASYEIIQHLIRTLPVLPVPRWALNKCQPIAIRDVIRYLVVVLEIPASSRKNYDICGPDTFNYLMMLKIVAEILNKRRYFFRFFISHVRFYSYFAGLLTPVPAPITAVLMEGLKKEAVCRNSSIRNLLPMTLLTYKESIVEALSREESDEVRTRWSGAYPPAHELASKLHEMYHDITFSASYSLETGRSASALFKSMCSIGGREGWFHHNWMWRMRGLIDKVLLGVGTSRGRRSQTDLKINDVIDFWRIEDLKQDKRLLLRAEMKLPGKAWLDFTITENGVKNIMSVTPYFLTHSFVGKLYWYVLVPFHHVLFQDLIKHIEKRAPVG